MAKEHRKSNQGYASDKYDKERAHELRVKGGSAKVPKGFATMSPEKFREVQKKAAKARRSKKRV